MANKIRVTLDPGHSINYNSGVTPGYYESNAMYDLSLYLTDELNRYGIFEVFNTKSKLNSNPNLATRGKLAITNGSRLFLSLHSNACGNNAKGVIALCSVKRPTALATELAKQTAALFVKFGSDKTYSRGIELKKNSSGTDYYGVLRNATTSYGVEDVLLMEHGFHDYAPECVLLNSTTFLKALAAIEANIIYNKYKESYIADSVRLYSGTATTSVNIRCKPSTSAQILGTTSVNQKLLLVGLDSGWYRILYNGCAAYVSSQYVKTATTVPSFINVNNTLPNITSDTPIVDTLPDASTLSTVVNVGVVTASKLNVRTGPGTKYSLCGSLTNGTNVSIYSDSKTKDTGWYYVTSINSTGDLVSGYVSDDYISVKDIKSYPHAYTTADILNVRTGPGTKYKVAAQLRKNTEIIVLPDNSSNDGWLRIIPFSFVDESTGKTFKFPDEYDFKIQELYVTEKYVIYNNENTLNGNIQASKSDKSGKLPIGFGLVTASKLNIRSGPGTKYSSIGSLSRGNGVIISGHTEDWVQIVTTDKIAYVSKKYVNITHDIGSVLDVKISDTNVYSMVQQVFEMGAKSWLCKMLNGSLTSPFGYRKHPITGKYSFHSGIDIGANGGTPIYSPVDGFAQTVAYDANGYGNYLIIIATDGTYHYFAHMKSTAIPKAGDMIHAGMKIGYVGTTGSSTGNHLHYEIRNLSKTAFDPNTYTYIKTLNKQVEDLET